MSFSMTVVIRSKETGTTRAQSGHSKWVDSTLITTPTLYYRSSHNFALNLGTSVQVNLYKEIVTLTNIGKIAKIIRFTYIVEAARELKMSESQTKAGNQRKFENLK